MNSESLPSAIELTPWLLGGALLSLGLAGRLDLTVSGAVLLTATGLWQLAMAHGAGARPGLVRIVSQGCWDVPLSFVVRHRTQPLLFCRSFDPVTAELPDSYWVVALPSGWDAGCLAAGSFEPPADSRLLGRVPARDLRFEHGRASYVDSGSLAAALRRVWPA